MMKSINKCDEVWSFYDSKFYTTFTRLPLTQSEKKIVEELRLSNYRCGRLLCRGYILLTMSDHGEIWFIDIVHKLTKINTRAYRTKWVP